ncbi:MAG: carbohydrate kinase family protein [Candidatus Bathyarchaeia archaeon]
MTDLVCVGAANVDLALHVDRFAKSDQEISVKRFYMGGGGSAANVAVGASRLGLSSGFLGNVGEDYFGDFLIREFENEGVDITRLRRVKVRSGLAVCIVDVTGERIIYTYGEANAQFSESNIDEDYIRDARVIYMSSLQGEKSFQTMVKVSEIASRSNIETFFDPGHIFIEKGLKALKRILKNVTVVKFNRAEINSLTGLKDIRSSTEKILGLGPQTVLTTLGGKGCHVATKKVDCTIPTYQQFKPVDKTGAGDSFNAGFIAGHIRGMSLKDSVRFANLVASISVSRFGARSTPTLSELRNLREFKEYEGKFHI